MKVMHVSHDWATMGRWFFLLSLLVSLSCKPRQVTTGEGGILATNSFVGPWVASTVDVTILSKNGGTADDAIHYDSKALAADQGRKPALTIFNADGSYREEIFNLHDSLVQAKAGFWHYYADTLYMRLDVESSPKISFGAVLAGKGLRLMSKIDWDGDGAKDDAMAVELKRP
jgi:hypothetical protein